jgi:hypothetical protein
MYFLTYNDVPDGIYMSQVIDVCKFWEDTFKERVRLVAFISLRNYFLNKAKIRAAYPDSIVFPMLPGIENWRLNSFRLKFFMLFRKKEKVIARGVFATLLALRCKKFNKVCFDARGAYAAEWSEYLKTDSPALAVQMKDLEKAALMKSSSRIAVSLKLVEYWKEQYGYSGNYSIIPCTLPTTDKLNCDIESASLIRNNLKIADNEVLLVYSGSSAEWQSFNKLEGYLTEAFTSNSLLKLLLLSKPGKENTLAKKFPDKVMQTWVYPDEVEQFLSAADYGLLIREDSITNKVSSPVKFAEYLAAGLPVIISEHIGDYSAFVKEQNCGIISTEVDWEKIQRPSPEERKRIQTIAEKYFRKSTYVEQYRKLF